MPLQWQEKPLGELTKDELQTAYVAIETTLNGLGPSASDLVWIFLRSALSDLTIEQALRSGAAV